MKHFIELFDLVSNFNNVSKFLSMAAGVNVHMINRGAVVGDTLNTSLKTSV